MRDTINDSVSVVSVYSSRKQYFAPHTISCQNKEYKIGEIGFHHHIKEGDVLHHVFECVDTQKSLWFRLNFDTKKLTWILEVVSDGLAS